MTDLFRRQRWLCDQEVADKFVCHKGGGGDGAGGDGLSGGDSQGMGGDYGDSSGGGGYGGGYGDASGWGNEGYGLGAGYGYGGDSQGMGGQYGDVGSWGGLAGPDAGAFGGSGGGGGGFGSASGWGTGDDAMNAYAAMTGVPGFPDAHIGIAAPAPNFGVNAVGNPYGLTGPTGVPGLGGIYGLPGADTEATFADAPAVAGHAGPGFAGPGFGGTGARGEGMGGPTGGFSDGVSGGPAGGPSGGPGGAPGGFSSWGEAEAAGVQGLTGGPDAVGGNGLGDVGAGLGVNFGDVTNPNPLSAFPNADPRATAGDPVANFAGRFGPAALGALQNHGDPEQAVINMARQAGIMGGPSWQTDFTYVYGISPGALYAGMQGAAPAVNAVRTAEVLRGFPGRFGNPSDPTFGRPGQSVFSDEFTEATTLADLAPGVNFNPTVDPSTVVDRDFNTIAAGPGNPGLVGLDPSVFQGRFSPGFSPDLMAALVAMGIPGKSGVDPSQDPMGPVAAVPSPIADPRGRPVAPPIERSSIDPILRDIPNPLPSEITIGRSTPSIDPQLAQRADAQRAQAGLPPLFSGEGERPFDGVRSIPPSHDPRLAGGPGQQFFADRGPPGGGGAPPGSAPAMSGIPMMPDEQQFPGVQPISPNMIPPQEGIGGLQPGSFAPRLSPREMALLAQKFS